MAGLSEGEITNQRRLGNPRRGLPCLCPPLSLGKEDGGVRVNRLASLSVGAGVGGWATQGEQQAKHIVNEKTFINDCS
jgi:hypothetical protein